MEVRAWREASSSWEPGLSASPGPSSPKPVTQLDGALQMAEAESGVGQGLHELGCGQQPLPGEPAEAALLNGHLLTVQPLLPVAHVLEELREGHVGRDSLWGSKRRADTPTAHPHHVSIFPELVLTLASGCALGRGSWCVPTTHFCPSNGNTFFSHLRF